MPLPLASAAEQACISSLSQGYGSKDQAELVRLFQPLQAPDGTSTPVDSDDSIADGPESLTPPAEVSKVGFVGLGAMGQGMARSIVTRGFTVQGYDTYPPSTERFTSFHADGKVSGKATAAASPAEAAKDAEVFVIVVQNAAQVSDVLFGAGRAADALPYGATIILSSTVPPSFSRELERRLDALGRGLKLVDAPVSGGVARAANGDLTVSHPLYSSREDKALTMYTRSSAPARLQLFTLHTAPFWPCPAKRPTSTASMGVSARLPPSSS